MRGFFGIWCLEFPILCLACNGEEPLLRLLAFMSQHITDPEWASNESTAPGEVAKTMFCCGVTARVCILQSLEAGGNQPLGSVQLTGDVNRLLMDQKWAAEPSTAPGQLTNKAHSSGLSSRDCFVQPLESGGEMHQIHQNSDHVPRDNTQYLREQRWLWIK